MSKSFVFLVWRQRQFFDRTIRRSGYHDSSFSEKVTVRGSNPPINRFISPQFGTLCPLFISKFLILAYRKSRLPSHHCPLLPHRFRSPTLYKKLQMTSPSDAPPGKDLHVPYPSIDPKPNFINPENFVWGVELQGMNDVERLRYPITSESSNDDPHPIFILKRIKAPSFWLK